MRYEVVDAKNLLFWRNRSVSPKKWTIKSANVLSTKLRSSRRFARLGVSVERVMTDNGSAYRSKLFAQTLARAGIRHIHTRPYTPRTNGKAERFIQTSLREWAYARPYLSSAHRNQAMGTWTDAYNLTRPTPPSAASPHSKD